jgi:hypothetical protein
VQTGNRGIQKIVIKYAGWNLKRKEYNPDNKMVFPDGGNNPIE